MPPSLPVKPKRRSRHGHCGAQPASGAGAARRGAGGGANAAVGGRKSSGRDNRGEAIPGADCCASAGVVAASSAASTSAAVRAAATLDHDPIGSERTALRSDMSITVSFLVSDPKCTLAFSYLFVIPAKAGIQGPEHLGCPGPPLTRGRRKSCWFPRSRSTAQSAFSIASALDTSNCPGCSTFNALITPSSTSIE
jgi:hypothetical protein